ncbi:MAG: hemerythrin domain-containing protein [Chloroflexota bacterium]
MTDRKPVETDVPHALQMLRDEHRRIGELLDEYKSAATAEMRLQLADAAIAEIDTHMLLEEEIVFPVIQRLATEETVIEHAVSDHREIEELADELASTAATEPEHPKSVARLHERFEEHVREEERDIFSHLEKAGEEEMVALGNKLLERRESIRKDVSEHGPAAPASLAGEAG